MLVVFLCAAHSSSRPSLTKPTICMTLQKKAASYYSVYSSCSISGSFSSFVLFLLFIIVLLATLTVFLSLSFLVGRDPKEKLALQPKGGERLLRCQEMTRTTFLWRFTSSSWLSNPAAHFHVTSGRKVEEWDVSLF